MMKSRTVFTILALTGLFIISSVDLKAQVVTGYAIDPEEEFFNAGRDDISIIGAARMSNEGSSSLRLSKEYTGQSVSKAGTFNVNNSKWLIRFSVQGEVKAGAITLAIMLPDGKVFKKFTMDESADIVWSESIKIKEGETKYHGEWKYKIETDKAGGRYSFSIKTY